MKKLSILTGVLLLLLTSCAPSVRIIGSWTSPEKKTTEGYSSLFVTALTQNILARQTVEAQLEETIRSQGVSVTGSFTVIPPGFKSEEADKEKILEEIRKLGSEAILTVTLLDQTSETRYVPGTTVYAPMGIGFRGRFWSYYGTYNPYMYDPGYYTTDKNYYLEANLYDTETEQLVWSCQSETTNPSSLEKFSTSFAKAVVEQLLRDGLIGNE
ncbi:hypothetical protein [Cyclobacterium xiamenense]|jgi:hypothetical protein|uniref:hypothetical protein n=1 Tax=Cyclobacterium xiamenense TaxID=1297121 RepID=UPI0035D09FC2